MSSGINVDTEITRGYPDRVSASFDPSKLEAPRADWLTDGDETVQIELSEEVHNALEEADCLFGGEFAE